MPAFVSLAKMELNGFGFSEDECQRQRKMIVARLEELEHEAYQLAGRQFSLTSPEDICQVQISKTRLCKINIIVLPFRIVYNCKF
jgi:DNA polymerase I-like protein with 3'-5' exonuclease and polymerase domains